METNLSNDTILQQLTNGAAQFQLVSSPVASVSQSITQPHQLLFHLFQTNYNNRLLFARISPPLGGVSQSNVKVEHYAVQKVAGDGRCMFRALVKGMARNKGAPLTPQKERDDADELRAALKEVICENESERQQYKEAVTAITVEEPLNRYCQRIGRPDFWGGESELLVLSKLCRQQIIVYIPENEHNSGRRGSGFIPIAKYGATSSKKKPHHVVRLLYSGRNHYDLLV